MPYLRVNPRDGRVFVLEAYDNRLSVWTPAGERQFSVGRPGEGPGDFAMPYRVHFEDSRFYVRDQSRFTYFSYSGSLLETVPNPPTSLGYQGFPLKIDALTADGSFLGRPTMGRSVELGLFGDDPVDSLPVFSIRASAAGWVRDVVHWRDIRNTTFALYYGRWLTFPGNRSRSRTSTGWIRVPEPFWSPGWPASTWERAKRSCSRCQRWPMKRGPWAIPYGAAGCRSSRSA